MSKRIGWPAIGGIFSFFAAAEAQTLALSTATTAFDGSYVLVSSTSGAANARCRGATPGPLVTAQGRAEFTNLLGHHSHFEGTIGSQGELVMRSTAIGQLKRSSLAWLVSGGIDRDGTVRARLNCWDGCTYDLVWQKEQK